jgi:hypothetical protein
MNYIGDNNKIIIHAKNRINTSEKFINKIDLGNYKWSDLEKYQAIFILPYNTSVMSYFEYYTANIPMIFPSKNFLLSLYGEYGVFSEISFSQVFKKQNKSTISYSSEIDPNNYYDNNLIKKAIEYSDFYGEFMPYITYIDDFSDLKNIDVDFKTISNKMNIYNKYRKDFIYEKWNNILKDINI